MCLFKNLKTQMIYEKVIEKRTAIDNDIKSVPQAACSAAAWVLIADGSEN